MDLSKLLDESKVFKEMCNYSLKKEANANSLIRKGLGFFGSVSFNLTS